MMEHEFLEQFISLTTTKLTAIVYTEFSPYLSCTMGNWECCFCFASNATCRSQSSDNTENDYKCIYRNLPFLSLNWFGSVLSVLHQCYMSEAKHPMNQKGDCGLLQSESLFAAALNQRSSYFRTLSRKSYVNAYPLTGRWCLGVYLTCDLEFRFWALLTAWRR